MRGTASAQGRLRSWATYPPHPQSAQPCEWREDLAAQLAAASARHGSTLAFGSGRSYGDSCLAASDHVLDLRRLDRFLDADWTHGTVVAEAGVTLETILGHAVPRGWFPSVVPGTQFVTLGGAIANDIHGKNHHRKGTFGRYVRRLGLLRSTEGRLTCSPTEHPELFRATIGGLGLTGVIEWAEIALSPIRSAFLDTSVVRFGNLDEFFALSSALDPSNEYSVAWIDCASRGRSIGRGVFMAANHAEQGKLEMRGRRQLTVPLSPPFSLVNHASLRVFNTLYWHAHPGRLRRRNEPYDGFLFQLDRILHWNRLYGARGFQQYQCVLPEPCARDAVGALLNECERSGSGSFLAVLKRFGDLASPGLLSFPMPGVTFALDFPHDPRLESAVFARMDAIVREANGRLYIAKDARMGPDLFRAGYPQWARLEAVRDPVLCSRFWRRVTA